MGTISKSRWGADDSLKDFANGDFDFSKMLPMVIEGNAVVKVLVEVENLLTSLYDRFIGLVEDW